MDRDDAAHERADRVTTPRRPQSSGTRRCARGPGALLGADAGVQAEREREVLVEQRRLAQPPRDPLLDGREGGGDQRGRRAARGEVDDVPLDRPAALGMRREGLADAVGDAVDAEDAIGRGPLPCRWASSSASCVSPRVARRLIANRARVGARGTARGRRRAPRVRARRLGLSRRGPRAAGGPRRVPARRSDGLLGLAAQLDAGEAGSDAPFLTCCRPRGRRPRRRQARRARAAAASRALLCSYACCAPASARATCSA